MNFAALLRLRLLLAWTAATHGAITFHQRQKQWVIFGKPSAQWLSSRAGRRENVCCDLLQDNCSTFAKNNPLLQYLPSTPPRDGIVFCTHDDDFEDGGIRSQFAGPSPARNLALSPSPMHINQSGDVEHFLRLVRHKRRKSEGYF